MKIKLVHVVFLILACSLVVLAIAAQTFTDTNSRRLPPTKILQEAVRGQIIPILKNPYQTPVNYAASDLTELKDNISLQCTDSCEFTVLKNGQEITVPAYVDQLISDRSSQIGNYFYDESRELIGYESLAQTGNAEAGRKFIVYDFNAALAEGGLIQVVWLDLPSGRVQYANYDQKKGLIKFTFRDAASGKQLTLFYKIDEPSLLIEN